MCISTDHVAEPSEHDRAEGAHCETRREAEQREEKPAVELTPEKNVLLM